MALVPMPGARAKGDLAYRPMARVDRPEIRAVASITPVPFMPAAVMKLACTTRMYAMVAKVVIPANSSVRTLVPLAFRSKNRFMCGFLLQRKK